MSRPSMPKLTRSPGSHWPRPLEDVDIRPLPGARYRSDTDTMERLLTALQNLPVVTTGRDAVDLVLTGRTRDAEVDVLIDTLRAHLTELVPVAAQILAQAQSLLDEQPQPGNQRGTAIRLAGASRDLMRLVDPAPESEKEGQL